MLVSIKFTVIWVDSLFTQPYSPPTVRVIAQKRRYTEGTEWHSHEYELQACNSSSSSRFECCVWHSRPRYLACWRLKSSVGINGTALNWFTSYLSNRSQRVSLNGCISDSFRLPPGVPQGSCLGPLLFTIYSSKLFEVIKYHLPQAHAYADDTQLYLSRLVLTPLLIRLMRSLPWSAVYWTFVRGCFTEKLKFNDD